MGGEDHVVHGEQLPEQWVGQFLPAQVAALRLPLALIDVHGEPAQPPCAQRVPDGLRFDQAAAGGVDQQRAGLHLRERLPPDEVMVFRRHGAVQDHGV